MYIYCVIIASAKEFDRTSIAGLMSWFGICITYLRFRQGLQVQGIDRKSLPYNGPGQPYLAWYGAALSLFVCFVGALSRLTSSSLTHCPPFPDQWMDKLHQGKLGDRPIRHQLYAICPFPFPLYSSSNLETRIIDTADEYGLQNGVR